MTLSATSTRDLMNVLYGTLGTPRPTRVCLRDANGLLRLHDTSETGFTERLMAYLRFNC